MRSYLFLKVFTILLFLAGTFSTSFPLDTDYPISNSTLVTGDTTILRRWDVGFWQADTIWASLVPDELYYGSQCPVCLEDTIWSFRAVVVDDSTYDFYFIVPRGQLPGTYNIAGYSTTEGPHMGSEPVTIYTPPFIFLEPEGGTVCIKDSIVLNAKALGNSYDDLSYQWYHNDIKISESFQGLLIMPLVDVTDTGSYRCLVTNQYGSDSTQEVRLDLHPFPASTGCPAGPDRFCPGTDSTVYTINSDTLATGYIWHLIPEEIGTIQEKDTCCAIFWDQNFTGNAKLCVEVSANCGSIISDTLDIMVPGISTTPEICIVGIDEKTGKYRIVWERSAYGSAQLFKVYRESNQAEVYMEIGQVAADEISFFVDSASVPDIIPHRYKISFLDTCGQETALSIHHQTMHLAANIGINGVVNLSWSPYTGIPFPAYNIYRGTHPDSMNLLIQLPSTVTTFTDNAPPMGDVNYQVGMSNPSGCDPVKKSETDFSSSLSNVDRVLITDVSDRDEGKSILLLPNPVSEILQIRYNNNILPHTQCNIYNSLGKAVISSKIRSSETLVDVSALPSGIYILQLSNKKESYTERFVINRK